MTVRLTSYSFCDDGWLIRRIAFLQIFGDFFQQKAQISLHNIFSTMPSLSSCWYVENGEALQYGMAPIPKNRLIRPEE